MGSCLPKFKLEGQGRCRGTGEEQRAENIQGGALPHGPHPSFGPAGKSVGDITQSIATVLGKDF